MYGSVSCICTQSDGSIVSVPVALWRRGEEGTSVGGETSTAGLGSYSHNASHTHTKLHSSARVPPKILQRIAKFQTNTQTPSYGACVELHNLMCC